MQAQFSEGCGGDNVQCVLCPHLCLLRPNKKGKCGIRRNDGGSLISENYGRITSAAMDPMEKKPLYHFHPGTQILSLGTVGCNLSCCFCQNFSISQGMPATSPMSPEQAVELAKKQGAQSIAYTYNEPMIWYEYVMDTAKLAHENGLKNVLVTNGYVNQDPLQRLLPHIDAANLDIKSIDDEFYKRLCGGRVAPVLQTARTMAKSIHLEVTNLVIPGENDMAGCICRLAAWIAEELGEDVPVHLSAYFPRYKLGAEATRTEDLVRAAETFLERSKYVYLGNVTVPSPTLCVDCGKETVGRVSYTVDLSGLTADGKCSFCGADNHFVV